MIDNFKARSEEKDSQSTQKLINALKKLDGIMSKSGVQNYQERLHRIAKTINSMEKHADCYVSAFSLDEHSSNIPFQLYFDQQNYQSEYLTVDKQGIIEFPDTQTKENFSVSMDELLDFMESDLKLNETVALLDIKKNEADSSSDEDDTADSLSQPKQEVIKRDHNKDIKKRFFNIELKLRAFIKEQQQKELLKGENFDTFINQARLKTPVKKIIKPNPSFIKTFFQESINDMEIIKKKRMTLMNEINVKNIIAGIHKDQTKSPEEKKNLIRSELIKLPGYQEKGAEKKKVSDFNIDPIIEDFNELTTTTTTKKPDEKEGKVARASIFKSPYLFDPDGNYIEDENIEPLTKEDVQSDSDDSNDYTSGSEYEEVEEEIEEEVEVEEIIKKKKEK